MSAWTRRIILSGLVLVGQAVAAGAEGEARYREGEVVVRFQGEIGVEEMVALAVRGHGEARIARTLSAGPRSRTALVKFPKDVPVEEMVARLQALPGVLSVEANQLSPSAKVAPSSPPMTQRAFPTRDGTFKTYPARAASALEATATATAASPSWLPNDPDYSQQPAVDWMGYSIVYAEKAPSPVVAVVGSGVDYRHPDLAGRVLKGSDLVNADKDPDDDHGSGTHQAGQIAALINNGKGIAGLSNGRVLAIKVLDASGRGTNFDAADGLIEAAANPQVKVILLSVGFPTQSAVLKEAVEFVVAKGKLLVVGAGDNDSTTATYPAAYSDPSFPTLSPGVISVAATGLPSYGSCPGPYCSSYMHYYCKARSSNYGAWIWVDAPGTDIVSTTPTHPFFLNTHVGTQGGYGTLEGTAQAAAAVAAAAARVWSVLPPGSTAAVVKGRLASRGRDHVAAYKGWSLDTNGDGVVDRVCQPNAMSNAVTLPDFAAAMGRAAIRGIVYDAHGPLTLSKPATVTAFLNGVPKGQSGVTQDPQQGSKDLYVVLSVPIDNATPYELRVNVPGYTTGSVAFNSILLSDCGGGTSTWYCTEKYGGSLSLPHNLPGQIHVVTEQTYGIDTHLFTPSTAPIKCDVGMAPVSALYCGYGSLRTAPFARVLSDSYSSELLSIKGPLYPTVGGTPYKIFLVDYGNLYIRYFNVVTRIWKGGKIVARVDAQDGDVTTNNCSYAGGANRCGAFLVGEIAGDGTFTKRAIYGTQSVLGGGAILPYDAPQGSGGGQP